ncbi:MAG TPA: hypothetical protein VNG13_14685 [Mycobacteriales bacterium]|nr:hypothetical protein [Mycobacteriales bacterium]
MGDRVQLTDLDVISRYSLAVRTATADRAELIAALEADLGWLRGRGGRTQAQPRLPSRPERAPAATRATTPARKAAATRARTPARKASAAPRRGGRRA